MDEVQLPLMREMFCFSDFFFLGQVGGGDEWMIISMDGCNLIRIHHSFIGGWWNYKQDIA